MMTSFRPFRSVLRAAKRLIFGLAIVGSLHAVAVTQAQASNACTAVANSAASGGFNFSNAASDPGNSSILTDWAAGDRITVNFTDAVGFSHIDGLYHGPSLASIGALGTTTVGAGLTAGFTYTVVAADLINGILLDPENNDTVVASCAPAAATTTALGSSVNPSVFGQSVTFTATVTSGAGTPTGTVTFLDGATPLGTVALVGGTTSLSTSTLSVASHSITATYNSGPGFGVSTSNTVTQVVNKASTTTAVSGLPNPSVFGQSVTLTATVSAAAPGSGTATGTVTFKDGATTLGTGTLAGGTATFSTSSLSVAAHSITAVYPGDGNFTTSTSSTATQTVNKGETTTAVLGSPNPSVFGESVTLTATVSVTSPAAGTPTGTVTFKDGVSSLGSSSLSGGGSATLSTSALSTGTHSITAVYNGDGNFTTSTSSPLSQNVVTCCAITVSASPSTGGIVSGGGVFTTSTVTAVNASANAGYTFINWTEGGVVVSTSANYSFTVSSARTLVANFSSSGTSYYVSPRDGSDTGVCPITAPCATLNYALSVTGPGGQVVVIGGGLFGPVVLTQEVSIAGFDPKVPFEIAADSTASVGCVGAAPGSCGANNGYGVEIAAGAADSIKFSNAIVTAGLSGAGALKLTSGGVVKLDDNVYRGNATATGPIVALYPNNPGTTLVEVFFASSDIGYNGNSPFAGAIEVKPSGNTSLKVQFNRVEVHNASYGIRTDGSLLSGPSVSVTTNITQSEFFSFANAAVNAYSTAGTGNTNAVFDALHVLNSSVGIKANGPQSTVILTNSTVSGNGIGVLTQNGGIVYTSTNNTVFGNGTDVNGTLTTAPKR